LLDRVDLVLRARLQVGEDVRLISRGDVAELWSSPNGSSGRLLVGSDQLDHVEFWDWRLESGDVHQAEAHALGTVEIVHVLEGDLALGIEGESYTAAAEESLVFRADADHSYGDPGRVSVACVHDRDHAPGRDVTPPGDTGGVR
jgi:quercetin dioxygenase-like cupin family protein